MNKSVFIVGSVNTDLVISASRFPEQGETVSGSDFFVARGGKGANQAVACARSEGTVLFCGSVGKDDFGKEAISSLKNDKIDVSNVKIVSDCPTGTAVIVVSDGNNRIIIDKGANGKLTEQDVDTFLSKAGRGDIFLTQLENPIGVIGYGLKRAKEKGLFTILNPAPASVDILPYLPFCDLIVPNETEESILGGREFLVSSVPIVLTTLGEKGYLIATKEGETHYPCITVDVVDTTAAGDTLCGALAARLAAGESLENAAKAGSICASIACSKKGAQPSIPTLKEALSLL